MLKKIINWTFVIGMVAVLLFSLVRTAFFPQEINVYENRKAETLTAVTLPAFLDGSLQDNMEKALADQAFFAQPMKQTYNQLLSLYLRKTVLSVAEMNPDRYVRLGDFFLFGTDHILYPMNMLELLTDVLDKRVALYNELFELHPDVDFYCYYIERDADISFQTGQKTGIFEYLSEGLKLPREQMGVFRINDFADYTEAFYKTDHHWKAEGAQRGYEEVLALLAPGETPIQPEELVTLDQTLSGSKAQSAKTTGFSEPFSAYRYTFPKLQFHINGAEAADYGLQTEYLNGMTDPISYGQFYGWDMGEVVIDTDRPERENVLLIGESYDNAILKLLSTHFNRTVSIDLRYYETYMGKTFSLSDCIRENEIDKVLFIGNVDYFVLDEFILED